MGSNLSSLLRRFKARLGIRHSSKLDFGLPVEEGDSNLYDYNQVKKQLDKTKKRIKTLVNVIDAQNTLLRRLARKIDPVGEMDSHNLEEVRPIIEEGQDVVISDFLDGQLPQQTENNSASRTGNEITAC